MEIQINKEIVMPILFLLYCSTCAWFTSLATALMIVPLMILSYGWLFLQEPPYAVCMISNHKDKCLAVMEEVAEGLGVERIIIYEAKGEDDYEYLGDLFLQPEYEIDLEDDEED